MADYAENILEAIELLTDKKIQNAGFDKTIKATIVSVGSNGEYVCSTGAVNFTAYGPKESYQVNDIVMVNIPQNNWDSPKMILNKVYVDNSEQNYIDPFSNFIDLHDGPLVVVPDETSIAANMRELSSRSLYSTSDFASLYDEAYTAIGIGLNYKTLLADELRVCDGTYGIRFLFNDENNVTLATYDISCDTLFGNIYNFNDWMPQKMLLKLDPEVMNKVRIMDVSLYQSNDFYAYNSDSNQREYLTYPAGTTWQNVKPNIFASNLKLYFGYSKEDITLDQIYLDSLDSLPQYYKNWSEEKNMKKFRTTVWTLDSDGNYQRIIKGYPDVLSNLLQKRYNESGEWVITSEFSEQESYAYDKLNDIGDLDSDILQYRVGNSNIITFSKFKPLPNSLEDDFINALSFDYYYKTIQPINYTPGGASFITNEEFNSLRYNSQENQLYSQEEFMCPHCLHLHWRPKTEPLQDYTQLQGATITYKMPAWVLPSSLEQATPIEKANAHFEFSSSTVIADPKPQYEYSITNDTVHYEFIDGISYLCWSLTLSDDFVYDETKFDEYYWWYKQDQTQCDDMRAFTLFFRPKEYYLPSMVNNKIYCEISKDDYTFTTEYDIPIDKIDFTNTKHKAFICTEDCEKPWLLHKLSLFNYYYNTVLISESTTINYFKQYSVVDNKLFHFCVRRQDYNDQISYKNSSASLDILRPLENYFFDEQNENFKGYFNFSQQMGVDCRSDETNFIGEAQEGYRYSFVVQYPNTGNPDYRTYRTYSFDIVKESEATPEDYVTYYDCGNGITGYKIKVYYEDRGDNIIGGETEYQTGHLVKKLYEITNYEGLQDAFTNTIIPNLQDFIIPFERMFKPGYWYYNDNNEYVESTISNSNITWYTLDIRQTNYKPLQYLQLQTKYRGMSSILEIPIICEYNRFVNETIQEQYLNDYPPISYHMFTGSNKIYFDRQEILTRDKFGPQEKELCLTSVNFFNENQEVVYEDDYKLTSYCEHNANSYIQLRYYGDLLKNFVPVVQDCYLRYDQVGFSPNHAEVGIGDNYPAETCYYSYIPGGETDTSKNYRCYLPIVYQQVPMYRDDFNEWNGTKVQIGDDAVYSPVIGAGTKEDGQFTGLLMGDVSRVDSGISHRAYGLYGYKKNEQVFGLKADGTMFLGKNGDGQLLFDGTKATIQSRLQSTTNTKGMLIDFDDGIVDMKNTKGGISSHEKEVLVEQQQRVVNDYAHNNLENKLNSLYNNSTIYDYIRVGDQEEYDEDTDYYTFSDNTEDQALNYYKYLDIEILQEGEDYYKLDGAGDMYKYTPDHNESTYRQVQDISVDPDPNIIYYIYDTNSSKQIAQPYPLTTPFIQGKDYQYKPIDYYSPLDRITIFSPRNDTTYYILRKWTNDPATWEDEKPFLYKKVKASYPNPEDTSQLIPGPEYGYQVRVYGGLVNELPGQQEEDKRKYYFYAILGYDEVLDTSGTPDSSIIYYILVDGEYEPQPSNLPAFTPGITYYVRSSDYYDIKMYQEETGKWANRFTHISDLSQFRNYAYLQADRELTLNALSVRNNDDAVKNTWETQQQTRETEYNNLLDKKTELEEVIDSVKKICNNYHLADGELFRVIEQGHSTPGDPIYDEALRVYNEALAEYNAIDNTINDAIDDLNDANDIIIGTDRINYRDAYVKNYYYQIPNYWNLLRCFIYDSGYDNSYSVYKAEEDLLFEYQSIIPDTGTPYGIKLDASDANIYDSSHEIDLNKMPLKIGNLNNPPFTVNWKGEMTATAGLIGGWAIGTDTLSSGSGDNFLKLSSANSNYPLQIGKSFQVDWGGKTYADDIIISGGTLSGTINAVNNASISNIKMINTTIVNGDGNGLKWDPHTGDLELDSGLELAPGGSINAGSEGKLKVQSGQFEFSGKPVWFAQNADIHVLADVTINSGYNLGIKGKYVYWKQITLGSTSFYVLADSSTAVSYP